MATDLHELDAWAVGLLNSISPAGRRILAGNIARELRRRSQDRIAAQVNPDGSAYEPRKPQLLRRKQGSIRRKMFMKLRTARYLKAEGSADGAVVKFVGQVQRMAIVHHYGLRDRVQKDGPMARYPSRELLGITDNDLETLAAIVMGHVSL
ncbi:phage virion morphogenesis protein [Pandoraea commovens]|uniref:Phage virion morphogenesis protein n=1 Tax=Pandoraea commovens TaxID=2508289 RepID=A0ABY5QIU7_9BURK|nr:phage virion morphogenesis protein [Pandoraea commovens]UVA80519.1 phage virion morphogenesis protein [Pandoraea commovens]